MEFKFQKVREYIAGLVGSPNLTEKMALDLDNALKADEASASQLLASTGQAQTTPPAGAPPVAVVKLPVAGTPTVGGAVATVTTTTEVPPTLEGMMAIVQGLQTQVQVFQGQKASLEQENKELKEFKASQSPTNMALQSENNGAAGNVRVSKTAEKDAKHLAELNRLAEQYPSLMSDIL